MPERQTQLDLRLVLPQAVAEEEECIARLLSVLASRPGVTSAHVVRPSDHGPSHDGFTLCLHYDPERLTLAQVNELVQWAGASTEARFGHLVLPFRKVGSQDEGRRIEEGLRAVDGVTFASANFAGQVVRVEYDRSRVDEPAILRRLKDLDLRPPAAAEKPAETAGWLRRNRELVWSIAAGVLLVTAWLLQGLTEHHFSSVPLLLYGGAYVFGAWDTLSHFLKDLRRGKVRFDIDLLMLVAAAGAAILGEWAEGALLLFLFSLGHALEHYALGRARHAIEALSELAPDVARVQGPDGTETEKPIDQVRPGDLVVVRPAERIPVDGEVTSGRSAVNQAPITGESMPVTKSPGVQVFAGSVNGDGGLVIKVTAAIGDRTLDRVVRLVEEAETQKAPTQQFTDRFERVFVPVVLIVDVLLIVLPPVLGVWWTWSESFYRGMALLVAASPCALALGTPAAVLAGIAQAARNGVLIKGGAHLESLGTVRVLALDKTGTITSGQPDVTDLLPASGVDEAELLRTAAAVERRSQHPLAMAVVRAANSRNLPLPEAGDLESLTGRGVRAPIGNSLVEIGRLLMFEEAGTAIPASVREDAGKLEAAGRSTIVVYRRPMSASAPGAESSGQWLGVIGVADTIRPNVAETLVRLRKAGIRRLVMVSGDNQGVANAVGREVGIDEVRAGLLPEDKVTAIKEIAAQGPVAMVGDGVNDAPALAHATVGIAMGGAGTAAALETADIALMGDELSRLPFLVGLSHKARGIIRQNLFISLGVVATLAVATASGIAGIAPAVVIHEGSTLVVIANALRLLAFRQQEHEL